MERKYGERGLGWDYCPEGTKNVFGGDARYIVNSLTEDQNAEIGKGTMMVGPVSYTHLPAAPDPRRRQKAWHLHSLPHSYIITQQEFGGQ